MDSCDGPGKQEETNICNHENIKVNYIKIVFIYNEITRLR